jgi:exosome complex component RRP40
MDNIERQIDEFVLPGDTIALSSLPSPLDSTSSIILGPGLHYDADTCAFTSHACGHIREPSSLTYYVDGHRPGASSLSNGDLVLGIVVRRQLETLLVDIGYNELASLSLYDFEGSTKRTKPNVDRGDVIYGRLKIDGECQPQITCINEDGKADGMGVLHENGYVFDIPIEIANDLIDHDNLLRELGNEIPYEIAIGANGRIWVKATTTRTMIALRKVLLERAKNKMDINQLKTLFAQSLVS